MRDMIKVMEKEKRVSLPLDVIDVVSASGHVIDPDESVTRYAQSAVCILIVDLILKSKPL